MLMLHLFSFWLIGFVQDVAIMTRSESPFAHISQLRWHKTMVVCRFVRTGKNVVNWLHLLYLKTSEFVFDQNPEKWYKTNAPRCSLPVFLSQNINGYINLQYFIFLSIGFVISYMIYAWHHLTGLSFQLILKYVGSSVRSVWWILTLCVIYY